jgi:DNA-binding CsgD family transcriptional regulator
MAPEILTEFIELKKTENGGNGSSHAPLTKRERKILELVLAGKNSKDIARKLNISKRTVDGHRANINNKFGVRNTAQLYKKALTYLYTL